MEGDDVGMTTGYSLQYRDLIAHLNNGNYMIWILGKGIGAYHVLSALHELLVDDLASIILSSLDMDCFFDDGVCAAA